jgi:hypothetical protein
MPLSIECVCEDAPNVSVCQLVEAEFQAEAIFNSQDWKLGMSVELFDASGGAWLTLPVFIAETDDGSASAATDIDIVDLQANWDTMVVKFTINSGLFQPLTAGKYASVSASWRIKMTFSCIDAEGGSTLKVLYAIPTTSDECTEDWPGFIRTFVSAGGGGGAGLLFNSSIVTPAECSVELGDWSPKPYENGISVDESNPTAICFCATGGTEPYRYSYSGTLPDGLSLDAETGCLIGTRGTNVSAAATTITVTVTDANQDQASVTCNLFQSCGGVVGNAFY